MARVKIKHRTGKDLFEFMQRSLIDTKLANDWALEEYVTINDHPLNAEKIASMNSTLYIQLVSKVFSLSAPALVENNIGIQYGDILIKTKPLHRDFVTELQTFTQRNKNNNVALLKYCLVKFFDISIVEIEQLPYQLVGGMITKVNFFLESLSTTESEFDIDDSWIENAQEVIG